jgi:hypothetical protein
MSIAKRAEVCEVGEVRTTCVSGWVIGTRLTRPLTQAVLTFLHPSRKLDPV